MSEQDVTVETDVQDAEVETKTQDQEVEQAETETPETEQEGEAVEAQEPEKTPEEVIEELRRSQEVMQKKIDRQTVAYSKLNEAHARQKQEYEQVINQVNTTQAKPEPVIDDFETHEDYVNALADYRAEQAVAAKEKEYAQRQEAQRLQQVQRERMAIADKQKAEYVQVNPNYEASEREFQSFVAEGNTSPAVEDAIVEQAYEGNICQLIDYFGANYGERMDELRNISQMTPTKAAVEIYKIQQKLAQVEAPKKETKKAPAPVNKPKAKGGKSKSITSMSGDELLKWVSS